MRRVASFKSSAFNTSEERDYFANSGCFGDDLAKWMMVRLRNSGYETDAEPGQEDFGWYFNFQAPAGAHCCIVVYQSAEPDGVWHMFLERKRGIIPSLLGGRNVGIDPAAVRAVTKTLESASEISELRYGGEGA